MRTLIVDDSATMRRCLERAMRLAGLAPMEIQNAADGRQALAQLRGRRPFDLILTDLNMPVMDGLEFLERRRAEALAPHVATAVIAVETSRVVIRRTIELGAHAYIPKPFRPGQLRMALMPLLRLG